MVLEGDTIILLEGMFLNPFLIQFFFFFFFLCVCHGIMLNVYISTLTNCNLFFLFLCMNSGMLLVHLSLEISQVNELCGLVKVDVS